MKVDPKDKISLSVIIPVYNEAELLNKSITIINSFMKKHFKDYEIIIIESGSTDGSKELTDQLCRKYHNVEVFHQETRSGFGSALKLGYQKASKNYVWLFTVDFPFPLNSILKALLLLKKYDCVLSYRSKDPRSKIRRSQSFIYNLLTKVILGLSFKQINSAFKLLPTKIMKKMPIISNGWLIDAEILYRLQKQKLSYIEIPVPLTDRALGKSKISPLDSLKMARDLFNLRKYLNN